MFKFIQKLREKPEKKRRAITFGVSLSVVVVIFFAWLATLVPRFSQQAVEVKEQTATPLSALKKNVDVAFDNIKTGAVEIKENINSIQNNPSAQEKNLLE